MVGRIEKWKRVAVLFVVLYTSAGLLFGIAASTTEECFVSMSGYPRCEETTNPVVVWVGAFGGFLGGVFAAVPAWVAVDVLTSQREMSDQLLGQMRAEG